VRRFIPSFVETVKPLQDMIKKDVEFKWGPKVKAEFDKIKVEITQPLTLMSLDFRKFFILYTFTSDVAFVIVLTQKDQEENEYLITFMIFGLQGA